MFYALIIQRVHHSWLDRNLDCPTAVHLVQGLLVLGDLEHVCDLLHREFGSLSHDSTRTNPTHHALDLDFAAVEVSYRAGETVRLREGADNLGIPTSVSRSSEAAGKAWHAPESRPRRSLRVANAREPRCRTRRTP